ncbi:MAG: DnaJ domain-containing protein [Alphaproteobacteria bacterium]
MPYLILALGLLIGFYAFSRFFMNATPDEIKMLIRNGSIAVVSLSILFLAVTGRLGTGLIILLLLFPVWFKFFQKLGSGGTRRKKSAVPAPSGLSEKEALDVLGLEAGAGPDEIGDAYKKLMQKVHPDNEGTDWMAAKLNQARDRLLKK